MASTLGAERNLDSAGSGPIFIYIARTTRYFGLPRCSWSTYQNQLVWSQSIQWKRRHDIRRCFAVLQDHSLCTPRTALLLRNRQYTTRYRKTRNMYPGPLEYPFRHYIRRLYGLPCMHPELQALWTKCFRGTLDSPTFGESIWAICHLI